MFVSFDSLPPSSRLWVYQANRALGVREEEQIASELKSFCDQWLAHGNVLRASFKIDYHQFIVLAVDENVADASGCSIDGSVKVLKALQHDLGIDFFDRTRISFLIDGSVVLIPMKDLKSSFTNNILTQSSLTFNTVATSKAAWDKEGILPAGSTWLSKYLERPAVV